MKLKKEAAEGQERANSLEAQIAELEQGIQTKSESMRAIEEKLRSISGLMQGSEAGRARLEMLERQTQEKFTRLQVVKELPRAVALVLSPTATAGTR